MRAYLMGYERAMATKDDGFWRHCECDVLSLLMYPAVRDERLPEVITAVISEIRKETKS